MSYVLQREGIDFNTVNYLLELLQVYSRGLCKRYRTFKDQGKEKSGKQTYAKTDNSRKKQRKRFHDESDDEPDALDKLSLGEAYRISHFLLTIDSLISALLQRMATYFGLGEKFSFLAKLGLGEISDDDLRSAAKNLAESSPGYSETELEMELVDFNAFFKGLQVGGALSEDKATENDMLLLIFDNYVHELFANVSIALKLYMCMFVTNCKGERSFKLNLILNYLRKSMRQKRLVFLTVLSIESQLLRDINFSSVIDIFEEDKARRKCF